VNPPRCRQPEIGRSIVLHKLDSRVNRSDHNSVFFFVSEEVSRCALRGALLRGNLQVENAIFVRGLERRNFTLYRHDSTFKMRTMVLQVLRVTACFISATPHLIQQAWR
jgi:hypothetical protein